MIAQARALSLSLSCLLLFVQFCSKCPAISYSVIAYEQWPDRFEWESQMTGIIGYLVYLVHVIIHSNKSIYFFNIDAKIVAFSRRLPFCTCSHSFELGTRAVQVGRMTP